MEEDKTQIIECKFKLINEERATKTLEIISKNGKRCDLVLAISVRQSQSMQS